MRTKATVVEGIKACCYHTKNPASRNPSIFHHTDIHHVETQGSCLIGDFLTESVDHYSRMAIIAVVNGVVQTKATLAFMLIKKRNQCFTVG